MLIKHITIFSVAVILGIIIYGCALRPYKPLPENSVPQNTKQDAQKIESPSSDARTQAASRLLKTAEDYLDRQMADDAINTLERVVSLDPSNGRSYYYLAEAWLMKGNAGQALEFNRLAGIYLKGNIKWELLVEKQKTQIDDL